MCIPGCNSESGNRTHAAAANAPKADSTPLNGQVIPCPRRNFVIVLAGPGKYNPLDRDHDQFWGNYFVAAQHLFGEPSLPKQFTPEVTLLSGECVHWLVYEGAYAQRWDSDKASDIQFLRDHAAKYPGGYVTRIRSYVGSLSGTHKYISIDSYQDLWETLYKLPDGSLTRLYYFGHGGPQALYMRWARDMSSTTVIRGDTKSAEQIAYAPMDTYKDWLEKKANLSDGLVSKFYACSSVAWAKKWNEITKLRSEGATSTISFKSVRTAHDLRGVENDGGAGWIRF